jgi:hypothetical protein
MVNRPALFLSSKYSRRANFASQFLALFCRASRILQASGQQPAAADLSGLRK